MNATGSYEARRVYRKVTRSRGPRGDEVATKRKRIKERTRELSREVEACKKFIATNLSFREALEKEIRQLVMLRDTMQSRFKRWRHNLGCALERFARIEEELLDDDVENDDDDDGNVNLNFAIEQIADEWDRIFDIIEESREEGIELERRVRLVTTTIVQLERYLTNRKMEHESLHVRLCEKLVSIIRCRRFMTAKFCGIAKTKNRA